MSEAAQRVLGPEAAGRGASAEDPLEPIALEARLAAARFRRTRALAAKSENWTPSPPPAPGGRAIPHRPPPKLAGLSAGAITAALGFFWIVDPFATPTKAVSPPHALTVPPTSRAQPADLLAGVLPRATGGFLLGAPTIAPFAPADTPQAPALSAPSIEAVDAAQVDEGWRQLSPVLERLLPAVVGKPLLPFVREPANPASTALPVSDAPLTARAALGPAAIWPVSATIPSVVVVQRAAARELPASAREFPLSDGPNYEPPILCDAVSCLYARPMYLPAATPAVLPVDIAVTIPTQQSRTSVPATPAAALSDAPANPHQDEVQASPTAPLARPAVHGADHRGHAKSPSATKVPNRAAVVTTSMQRTGSPSGRTKSGGRPGVAAESYRYKGQGASKFGAGKGATSRARSASVASGPRETHSPSSGMPERGTGAAGRKNSDDGATRSDSGHAGSHGKSGKGGSPSGAGKSGGGSKGGRDGNGGGGGDGGKGKGGGRH